MFKTKIQTVCVLLCIVQIMRWYVWICIGYGSFIPKGVHSVCARLIYEEFVFGVSIIGLVISPGQ